MEKFLDIKNLNTSYDSNKVLKNVSLKICQSDKILLIGDNASGKTTFLKILSGEKSYEGEITFNDRAQRIFYYNEKFPLIKTFNGYLNILFMDPDFHRIPLKKLMERVEFCKKSYHLEIDLYKVVELMTVSERFLVLLLRSLFYKCDILLLDEAFSELTSLEKEVIYLVLQKLDLIVLYVTHQKKSISHFFNRIFIFEDQNIREITRLDYREVFEGKETINPSKEVEKKCDGEDWMKFDFNSLEEYIFSESLLYNYKVQLFNLNLSFDIVEVERELEEFLKKYQISYFSIHQSFQSLSLGNKKKFKFMMCILDKSKYKVFLNLFENLDDITRDFYRKILEDLSKKEGTKFIYEIEKGGRIKDE